MPTRMLAPSNSDEVNIGTRRYHADLDGTIIADDGDVQQLKLAGFRELPDGWAPAKPTVTTTFIVMMPGPGVAHQPQASPVTYTSDKNGVIHGVHPAHLAGLQAAGALIIGSQGPKGRMLYEITNQSPQVVAAESEGAAS